MGKMFLISGMDRSGTSLCAAVSEIVGLHLGDQLIGPRKANPKGYFEDRHGVSINHELLRQCNYGRKLAAPLPDKWQNTVAARLAGHKAKGVIHRLAKGGSPFGFKDPRLCLTAPVWIKRARSAGHEIGFITCVRNPLEVSASLHKRDGLDKSAGCLIWLTHTLSIIRASAPYGSLWVDYQTIMSDPHNMAAQIKSHVTGTQDELTQDERKRIDDFVDVKLWRNRSDSTPENHIEEVALELYTLLKDGRMEEVNAFLDTGPGQLISLFNHHASVALNRWVPECFHADKPGTI